MKFFWVLCLLVLVVYARKHPKRSDEEIRQSLSKFSSLEDIDKVKSGLKRINERSGKKMRGKKDNRAERLLRKAKKHEKKQEKGQEKTADLPENDIHILNEQAGLSDYMYEGDIVLRPQQLDELETDENQREKRMAQYGPGAGKWAVSKPIRYQLHSSLIRFGMITRITDMLRGAHHKMEFEFNKAQAITAINDAIELYNTRTCIHFERNDTDPEIIFFFGDGCWSWLGYAGGVQPISIGWGCEWTTTVVHEIAHALGYVHEQSRVDRNNHITLNMENVQVNKTSQYTQSGNVDSYSQIYDYGSVMHYGAYGFAIDRSIPVILAIDEIYQKTLGSANYQLLDFEAINNYYECSTQCAPLECKHKGVVNPNDCTKCLCADAWTGDRCETRAPGNTAPETSMGVCGETLTPTSEWQYVGGVVGTFSGEAHATAQECFWTIETDGECKKNLQLRINSVLINYWSTGGNDCFFSGGHIYLHDDPTSNPLTVCFDSDDVVNQVLNSTGAAVIRGYTRMGFFAFNLQYRLAP